MPFPPSMNHRYIPMRGRLILSPEYRSYKNKLSLFLHKKLRAFEYDHDLYKKAKLSVEVCYQGGSSAWFTKKGDIKKIDVDNRHKTILDVVFPFLKIDDSQIFEFTIKKVIKDSGDVTVDIKIDTLK